MRTSLTMAVVVAAAGTAASAGALNLLGSDTLFTVTQQAISGCSGAAGLIYLGTGSGNGEAAMLAGTQAIAPMSRFLNDNVCAAPTAAQTTAEGLVIGLDGIAVLGSMTSAGPAACNGTDTTDCNPEAVGLAFNTTVGDYTFSGWKDILAVIYGGKSHEFPAAIIGNGGAHSGCASPLRAAIANTWGNLFQKGATCAAASADGCTQLQHAFRQDDASGTSAVLASLVGLSPAPTAQSNLTFGTSPFCNVNEAGITLATAGAPIQIRTTIAHHMTTGQTVQIVGVGEDINANPLPTGDVAANGTWTVTVLDALNFVLNGSAGVAGQSTVGSFAMALLSGRLPLGTVSLASGLNTGRFCTSHLPPALTTLMKPAPPLPDGVTVSSPTVERTVEFEAPRKLI